VRRIGRVALELCIAGALPALAHGSPLVQILAPPDGEKVRDGDSVAVVIRVEAGIHPLSAWTLTLGDRTRIASGTQPVDVATVAELSVDHLAAGERLDLTLDAIDESGGRSAARIQIGRPAPRFAVIPLEPGYFSSVPYGFLSVDDAGSVLIIGGTDSRAQIRVMRLESGEVVTLPVEINATEGIKLSPDGARIVYLANFRVPGFDAYMQAIGYYRLATGERSPAVWANSQFFTTDHTGSRIAYHEIVGFTDRSIPIQQYFFYDAATDTKRQLTNDPDAIHWGTDRFPYILGRVPMISGDGDSIVFASSATLGIAPSDPGLGVHVFTYDVPDDRMRYVTSLPRGTGFDVPALSRDGRWLSFVATESGTGRPPAPALIDLTTAELTLPLLEGVRGFASFDSVVSPDGTQVVISTRADLDPRVGNADHNMELFVYDRITGDVSQLVETVGGIGSRPGGCGSYRPKVSADARVVAFATARSSGEGCSIDGTQRHEIDGFYLRFVRTVPIRPGNRPPVFSVPERLRLGVGQPVELTFTATDPDGDRITFFAQERGGTDVLPGSVIEDHHDGTATFEWPTRLEHAGTHYLRVAAFDEGGGEVFHDIQIDVVARPACPGDCDGDGAVAVTELLMGVRIALGHSTLTACTDADADVSGSVSIDELVAAIGSALSGCS